MEGNATDSSRVLEELAHSVDDAFLLANAIFVCLMQCGFACLEAGAVRSKNTTNIIMKNLMDLFICCVAYWLVGYALAYGPDLGAGVAGGGLWAGIGIGGADHRWSRWFFQFTFAATAATIVSGAVAERCRYEAYLCYSALISGVVYPVTSHWAWGEGGWLSGAGYRDFAGAGPVHLLAGAISLVAAALLGPRAGRFDGGKGAAPPPAPHSTPLVGLGGLILIAGFLAFNGGSVGGISAPGEGQTVARVMAVTVMGGAGGAITSLAVGRAGLAGGGGRWPFGHTLNAAFAGMVSVCASADVLPLWAALAGGVGAGALYFVLRAAVARARVDDPLDVVAVHGGGGAWGLLGTPLLAGNAAALDALPGRALGAAALIAWALGCSLLLFGALRLLGLLRVAADAEARGLDDALHGEPGYPVDGWIGSGLDPVAQAASAAKQPPTGTFRSLAEFTDYHNAAFEDGERPPARR